MHRVTDCRASMDYRLWIRFYDGLEGSIFLGNLLDIGVFCAWRDIKQFCRASVDPDSSTVVWGGEIRFDPDILHQDLLASRSKGFGLSEFSPAVG